MPSVNIVVALTASIAILLFEDVPQLVITGVYIGMVGVVGPGSTGLGDFMSIFSSVNSEPSVEDFQSARFVIAPPETLLRRRDQVNIHEKNLRLLRLQPR